MWRFIVRSGVFAAVFSVALVGAASVALTAASASPAPIRGHQYFVGLVNGRPARAGLSVVCSTAGTGEVLGGQTLEAISQGLIPANAGYTGRGSTSIEAELVYSVGRIGVIRYLTTFSKYGVSHPFPTVSVPCGGKATVVFLPNGRHTNSASVKVTFENVGSVPPPGP
jgi:hypothetical protein